MNVEHRREVEIEAKARQFPPHRGADGGGLARPARGVIEAGDGRRRAADASALVIDRDQQSLSPRRGADIVDQPPMAVEPGRIRQVMAKIAFEQDDACGLQIPQQRLIPRVEARRRPQPDDEMVAHRVD